MKLGGEGIGKYQLWCLIRPFFLMGNVMEM